MSNNTLDESDGINSLDVVQEVAEDQNYTFERTSKGEIHIEVPGQWRNYFLLVSHRPIDRGILFYCTTEMQPPANKLGGLYELLNLMNDQTWNGAFSWDNKNQLLCHRYSLCLGEEQSVSYEQVMTIIVSMIAESERFYPAIQLVVWSNQSPESAMQIAIQETRGSA